MTHDERKALVDRLAALTREEFEAVEDELLERFLIDGHWVADIVDKAKSRHDELASERDALAGKVKVEMDRAEASYSRGWSDRAAKDESAVLRGRIAELEKVASLKSAGRERTQYTRNDPGELPDDYETGDY